MLRNCMSHLHIVPNTGARLSIDGDGSADCGVYATAWVRLAMGIKPPERLSDTIGISTEHYIQFIACYYWKANTLDVRR